MIPSAKEKLEFLLVASESTDPTQCILWPWTKPESRSYPKFTVFDRTFLAARCVMELKERRQLGPKEVTRHLCNEFRCVNAAHLTSGTQADNIADKVKSDRQARGEGHGMVKLTEDDVIVIRHLCREGWTYQEIADRFEIDQSNVGYIVKRKVWRHVAD